MRSIHPEEAVAAIGRGARVVDVRTRPAFGRNGVPGSVNLPLDELEDGDVPPEWDRDGTWLVVCEHGAISELAVLLLESEGFRDVANVRGGLLALRPLLADEGA